MEVELAQIALYPIADRLGGTDPQLAARVPADLRLPHTFGTLPLDAYEQGLEWVDDARDFVRVAEELGWERAFDGNGGRAALVRFTRETECCPCYTMAYYIEGDVYITLHASDKQRAAELRRAVRGMSG